MTGAGKALLLVGSARGAGSSSHSLGKYLLGRLGEHGVSGETAFVFPAPASGKALDGFMAAVRSADLIVLAFPLYVDSLAAEVIRSLELVEADRRSRPSPKAQTLVAICNSGFPESSQNLIALDICRSFCRHAGIHWAGGFALGGGAALGGRPLEKAGGMFRNVRRGLDAAAAALAAGNDLPQEAMDLVARPLCPKWLYLLIGSWGMRRQARSAGASGNLGARPYSPAKH